VAFKVKKKKIDGESPPNTC